ncbi:ATP-binding protein [Streptomyces sp. NPDC021098]|uniref:ATP-binding protein n=1 Tax=unclassified Streptomyces TaxID=2593676 RepID=UPI0037B49A05
MAQLRDGDQVLIWRWSDGDHDAGSRSRVALRCTLRELGIQDEVISDAVMAAWELTANALEHARGPYEMRLLCNGRSFVFEVEDSDPCLPAMPSSRSGEVNTFTGLAERGRGLRIVEAFTRGRWGFHTSGSETKIAWMEFSTTTAD